MASSAPGMKNPFGRPIVIADLSEETGRVREELPRIERKLGTIGLDPMVIRAETPTECERAARDAIRAGELFLAACGGDRAVHFVANGMFEAGRQLRHEAVLGAIPVGGPCDFVRTFGFPTDAARACEHLVGDRVFPIDAAIVSATSNDADNRRTFVNIAEVGLGASILRRIERLPRGLGRGRRFLAFWLTLAAFRLTHVKLTGDRRTWEGKVHDVVVANGQFQGDGLRISPKSWPDDGYLDVLVMKGPRSDAFTMLPKTPLGEHLPHPNIVEYRSRTLRVESERPLWVQADGQLMGTTPATFEVVPKAVRLKT
jgi:diacylglycerol kinase (ATP)